MKSWQTFKILVTKLVASVYLNKEKNINEILTIAKVLMIQASFRFFKCWGVYKAQH